MLAPEVESRTPDATNEPATTTSTLHGRVVVIDANGQVLSSFQGELRLGLVDVYERGSDGRPRSYGVHAERTAPVVDGGFTLELGAHDSKNELSVQQLTIGERLASVDSPSGVVPIPADSNLEVRARLPRASTLRVVDAESGAELSGITLLAGWYERDELHPGSPAHAPIRRTGLASPIDLDQVVPVERRTGRQALYVGVDGFAWTPVAIDFEHGGERTISLERGGGLDLSLVGATPEKGAALRLYAAGRDIPIFSDELRSQREVHVTGLLPGALRVAVELGEWYDEPIVLGSASVSVTVGRSTAATLTLEAPPKIERVLVRGLVFVGADWQQSALRVGLERTRGASGESERDRSTIAHRVPSDRAGFDAFAWELPDVPLGGYELDVFELGFAASLDISSAADREHVFEIAPPCEHVVRVVDGETGRDVVVENLEWSSAPPEGGDGGVPRAIQRDDASGRYAFRAPCGVVVISVWNTATYQLASARVDLSQVRETTLRLERASGVNVVLRDGDAGVPWPPLEVEDPPAVQPAAGTTGQWIGTSCDGHRRRYRVSAPGDYTLHLPRIAGYAQPSPRSFAVQRGEFADVIVQLERERR